jgi:hypothetical protein
MEDSDVRDPDDDEIIDNNNSKSSDDDGPLPPNGLNQDLGVHESFADIINSKVSDLMARCRNCAKHVQDLDIQLKAVSEQVASAKDGLCKATVVCRNAAAEVTGCAKERELSHAKWEAVKNVKVQRAEKQVRDKEGSRQEKRAYKNLSRSGSGLRRQIRRKCRHVRHCLMPGARFME